MVLSATGRMLVARGLYRRWLAKYFSTVTLAGLAPDDEPILLRRIYVPLILTKGKVSDHAPEDQIHHGGQPLLNWLDSRGKTLLISGEAGSGKTTLVSAVVDSLAGEVGDDLNQRLDGYVPFPIRLREAPLDRIGSLGGLVNWWLEQAKQETPDLDPSSVYSFLEMGRGILLLDGLDEVGTLNRRTRFMDWLRNHPWVQDRSLGRKGQAAPQNLVIVTARPSGFEGLSQRDLPPAQHLFVAPFSHDQIRAYLTRWFELRPLRSEQRQNTVENLVARLTSSEQSGRLLPLARRPAYLASLAFVHGTRGELPYTRAALYEQLVEAYIEMLDRQKGVLDRAEQEGELPIWDRQEKIEVLSAVAFQAHVGATSKERTRHKEEDRRFLWSRGELEDAVHVAVEDGADRFRTIRSEHVSQLTGYFVARTGLLVETREGQYQFGHLSFQEYLTALFVLNRATAGSDKAGELERILFPRLGEPGWLEVGVLGLAIDANRSGGKGHEPILARLDLKQPDHLAFLAQLLSGEEIRFTAEERRAWVLVWLTFWAIRRNNSAVLESVFRFPTNREILEEAWRTVSAALGGGESGLAALEGLVDRALAQLEQPAQPIRRGLDALIAPSGDEEATPEMPAVRRAWSRRTLVEDRDLPAARLLAVPLLGDFVPPGAKAVLRPLPSRVELFRRPQPGRVEPTHVQYSLDSWALRDDSLLRELAEQTPLLWWLYDEFFALRVSSVDQEAMPLILWREAIRKRLLAIEHSWRTTSLMGGKESQAGLAPNWGLSLDLDLDLDLAWARALPQTRVRELDLARDLKVARELVQNLDLARDLERDLERLPARPPSPPQAWVGDLARDLALARSLNQNLTWPKDLLARSTDLQRIVSILERKKKSFDRNSPLPIRIRVVNLFQAAIQSVSLGWLLGESLPVRRPNLTSALVAFRNPESVTAPLQGTPFAEQALQEWEDVLASPFSPIPMLEDALSREWKELPTDPEGIAQLFDKALSELEKRR